MNSITDLLDLEDSDIIISDISIQGQTKTITLETTGSSLLPFLRLSHALVWYQEQNDQPSNLTG